MRRDCQELVNWQLPCILLLCCYVLCFLLKEWIALPNALTPWADGHYLPDEPAHLVLEGRHAKVDIISGVTRDEGAFGIRNYANILSNIETKFSSHAFPCKYNQLY